MLVKVLSVGHYKQLIAEPTQVLHLKEQATHTSFVPSSKVPGRQLQVKLSINLDLVTLQLKHEAILRQL